MVAAALGRDMLRNDPVKTDRAGSRSPLLCWLQRRLIRSWRTKMKVVALSRSALLNHSDLMFGMHSLRRRVFGERLEWTCRFRTVSRSINTMILCPNIFWLLINGMCSAVCVCCRLLATTCWQTHSRFFWMGEARRTARRSGRAQDSASTRRLQKLQL